MTPLDGVHDETIYGVLNEKRGSRSWLNKCNELEGALVKAGWTPPAGHPLAVSPAPLSLAWSVAMNRAATKAREWAGFYSEGSEGRDTFVLFAEWAEEQAGAPLAKSPLGART